MKEGRLTWLPVSESVQGLLTLLFFTCGVRQKQHSGRGAGRALLMAAGRQRGRKLGLVTSSFFLFGSIWAPSPLEGATPNPEGLTP